MATVVIGAGFTGIAAAWELSKQGHEVVVLEYSQQPGGLAAGFKADGWQWPLEYHYHHIFASDTAILELINEMNLAHLVSFKSTRTGILRHNHISRLDSPISLLQLPFLSFIDKCRVGMTLAFLKATNQWKFLEKFSAASFLTQTMGTSGYNELWKPLLVGKFGAFADQINAAWFWARIKARTKHLGYFNQGFAGIAQAMVAALESKGVSVVYGCHVEKIVQQSSGKINIHYKQNEKKRDMHADTAVITLPASNVIKMVEALPNALQARLKKLNSLAAVTVILELNAPLFRQGWYWVNINDPKPFLAVVEHTNFVDAKHYGNKTIVYIGKYLSLNDPLFSSTDEAIVALFTKHLKKLPGINAVKINRSWVNKAPFAQPIAPLNQSQHLPPHVIWPGKLYWASMQHVYPWDRGTNFAVGAGIDIARRIIADQEVNDS
jgi:protoporphyrinogen oxidase